ncbi:VOC family protein [Anaerotignum sp. MB30-C6]|uniref:VOC family protein n=1 Tax=Anaerotignum sp. MB30-C6 TaxID=3070814 RepID=UPI0027DDB3C9|nr:VOC family protein [Anaerotignum sp. MB30-C6]WMI82623.1 VOC family protein [Anaerotignum sp. MB30-C6]
MKPMRMHHVGIVIPTIEKAQEIMDLLGLTIDYTGYVEAYEADLIFTKHGEFDSPIEFIIPQGGVLKDFNEGRGGIAHVAFEVEDVEAVAKEMQSKGKKMLESASVPGTEDIKVNFLRPKYSNGILFEFVETVGPINYSFQKEGEEGVSF